MYLAEKPARGSGRCIRVTGSKRAGLQPTQGSVGSWPSFSSKPQLCFLVEAEFHTQPTPSRPRKGLTQLHSKAGET